MPTCCKRFSVLALLLLFVAIPDAAAQMSPEQQQQLIQLADRLEQQYETEHAQAVERARELGLPVRKKLPDGRLMFLERFAYGRPMYIVDQNRVAAQTSGTAALHPEGSDSLSLTGEGQTLGMWEIGKARGSHRELEDRITQQDAGGTFGTADHATHVAGIMIGAGVRDQAQGMSYEANLDAYTAGDGNGEMSRAASNGLQVSNHSYGYLVGWVGTRECGPNNEELRNWLGDPSVSGEEDWKFGYYGGAAKRWDRIAYRAPYYLITKSAGNEVGDNGPERHCEGNQIVNVNRPPDGGQNGFDSVSGRDAGKNVFSIGAAQDIPGGYEEPSDVDIAGFSSRGPTDDGRIKPDLVGNGTGLVSSVGGADDAYDRYWGTSMSSPNVSGSIGLLLEHQRNLHAGTRLKAATIKALLIQTTNEAGPGTGPDYRFGWGLMNTTKAAHLMSRDAKLGGGLIQERTMTQNDTIRIPVEVSERGEPLRATISWYDPPGRAPGKSLDPREPMLVNDLDLRVVGPNGEHHQPWVLDVNNPSQAATRGDNTVDNTEQVFLGDPAPGRYVVEITHKDQLQEETMNNRYQAGSQDVSVILDRKPGERYTISGRVTLDRDPSVGAGNVTVKLSSFAEDSTTTGPDGYYEFPGLYNGDYAVTTSVAGDVSFDPTRRNVTVDGGDVQNVDFSAATPGQRLVTLRLNTSTLPDTLNPHDTVTVRGCLEGCNGGSSTLPDGNVLARNGSTTLTMTNAGGDYWRTTFAVPDAQAVNFRFYSPLAERDGLGGLEDGDDHRIEAGIGNLALPLHYFEKGDDQNENYAWSPWQTGGSKRGMIAVQFRVYLPEALSPILPPGVRGNDLGGDGPLRRDQSRLSLEKEAEDESKPGYHLYSDVAYYPSSTTGETQRYRYKLNLRAWEEASDRTFVVPDQDTTLHWTYAANAKPSATRDEGSTGEEKPVTINVLANDSDFDEDSLSIVSVSDGRNGTASIASDSTVRYVPDPDFDGEDKFSYTVSDGRGGTAKGVVNVFVNGVNDVPIAPAGVQPADTSIVIEGDASTPLAVSWKEGSDPDDSSLSYTWQLAATETFETLLLSRDTGEETSLETDYGTVDSLLASAGVEQDESITLYHRVLAADDDTTTAGTPVAVSLRRGNVKVGIERLGGGVPTELSLRENYPNPFAQATTIEYGLPEGTSVRVVVYNTLGQRVRVLADRRQSAGWHALRFQSGELPSGAYVVRIRAGGDTRTGRMTLVQ
jgi:hypothetical protein